MYLEYYGLSDLPFRLAPDPRYLFRTESLLEVLANLQYGIENGKGLVVATGEVGTGKTTTLRVHLRSLDQRVLAAYIFNPLLTTSEFFDTLASEFRLRPQQSKSATLRMLGSLLLSRHSRGLRTVLVIDEAHLLPHHLLEEIRLLSNFETNSEKLLQIVLCGQPELLDVLEQPELRQLKQRVSLRCSIQPMTLQETAEYIRWRLRVAKAKSENLFDREAVAMIHMISGGIPRIINNVCDNSLLTGFSRNSTMVTGEIVAEVIELLGLGGAEAGWSDVPATAMSLEPDCGSDAAEAEAPSTEDVLDSDEPLGPILPAPFPAATPLSPPHNVSYIRPEYASYRRMAQAEASARDAVRFIIEFEDREPAAAASAKYFSRVKVTKR